MALVTSSPANCLIRQLPQARHKVSLAMGFYPDDLDDLPSSIIPEHTSTHFVSLAAITSEVFEDLRPSLIVTPLVFQGCDACDVAARLVGLGFDGCYRVISSGLPQLDMVRDEISDIAPNLTVELYSL